MDDLKLTHLVRRNRALIEQARKVVEEARRQNGPLKHFTGEARDRSADLAEWAKAATANAEEERIQAQDVWDRAIKAMTALQVASSRSGRH